jgi:hypothetical protein
MHVIKHVIWNCTTWLPTLTLKPLTWKIWWAPNNANRWQMGFNSAFKGLTLNSMTQIHTSVTLLTSRDLAWSFGRLTCQHACQHASERHVSRPELHVRSRDVCRVTEVWICAIEFNVNPLNAELNPICHLLALLGSHPILHVNRIKVKSPLTFQPARVTSHEITWREDSVTPA